MKKKCDMVAREVLSNRMYDNLSGPYIGLDVKTIKVVDNKGEWSEWMLVLLCICEQVHVDINLFPIIFLTFLT